MGNQNILGLKYCCRHKPQLNFKRDDTGFAVVCFKCGKTVDGFADADEAIKAWNDKQCKK